MCQSLVVSFRVNWPLGNRSLQCSEVTERGGPRFRTQMGLGSHLGSTTQKLMPAKFSSASLRSSLPICEDNRCLWVWKVIMPVKLWAYSLTYQGLRTCWCHPRAFAVWPLDLLSWCLFCLYVKPDLIVHACRPLVLSSVHIILTCTSVIDAVPFYC